MVTPIVREKWARAHAPNGGEDSKSGDFYLLQQINRKADLEPGMISNSRQFLKLIDRNSGSKTKPEVKDKSWRFLGAFPGKNVPGKSWACRSGKSRHWRYRLVIWWTTNFTKPDKIFKPLPFVDNLERQQKNLLSLVMLNRLIRGYIAYLKGELLAFIIMLVVSGIIYVITQV
jgi:hypothetical protein